MAIDTTLPFDDRTEQPVSLRLLKWSVGTWFTLALIGQWLFAAYVFTFYGGTLIGGQLDRWTEVVTTGVESGRWVSNSAILSHMLLAGIISVVGPLQFIPWIRNRYRTLHRYSGRLFVIVAVILATSGSYMSIVNGTVGSPWQQAGTIFNGLLIVVFAAFALVNAMKRNIAVHQRWALRLFIVVSGVWFFRVGLMAWLMIHQAPVGFDPETFTGPFLLFWSWANFLLPLALAEIYLRLRDRGSPVMQATYAVVLVPLTLLTALGIFGALMSMWIPQVT